MHHIESLARTMAVEFGKTLSNAVALGTNSNKDIIDAMKERKDRLSTTDPSGYAAIESMRSSPYASWVKS